MKKNFIFVIALLGTMTGASLTLNSCGGDQSPQVPAQAATVCNVLTINKTNCATNDLYSASIKGQQDVSIMPQVSGTLVKLCVKEGQRVHKGQIMFVIDQVPYKSAFATAQANVTAAKASVATAQLTYDSKKELRAKNIISDFDLQQAENTLYNAKAGLAQAEAQEVNARNSLSYTEVKSPVDGVVGTLPFRVGALVSPSMPTALTTVSDNKDMYVYFSMTEKQMLELVRQYGTKEKAIKEMPEIVLLLSDGSTYEQKGKLETISGVIDENTGSVSFRAVFPNKDGLLSSGGSGNVLIPSYHKNAIIIPQSCTFELQDKRFVYKVVDGSAVATNITTVRTDDGRNYIVTSGLNEGDVIVAEGVGMMREGTLIQPKEQSEAAAPVAVVATDSLASDSAQATEK